MKRLTRDESRQQTRERLLDAAQEVFSQHGFYNASIDAVAETAGYSKGAVYSNFGSKDELFLALFDRRLETNAPHWLAAFQPGNTPEQKLKQVERMMDMTAEERRWLLLELEFFLYAMRNDDARKKLSERYSLIRGAITSTLEQHFSEIGANPSLPLDEMPWFLLALNTGLHIQALIEPGAMPSTTWTHILNHL